MDRPNSNNKTLIIAVAAVISVLILAIAAIIAVKIWKQPTGTSGLNRGAVASTPTVDPNAETYQKAVNLFNQKNYKEAATLFTQLGDYKDAINKTNVCNYQQALNLYNAKRYDEALALLNKVTNLAEATALKEKCNIAKKDIALYKKAKSKYKKGKYTAAIKLLNQVKNYAPAKSLKKKVEKKKKNMPPAAPDVEEFVDVTPPVGDGTTYEVRWSKVPGASGYEYYCKQEIAYGDGTVDDDPYYEQQYTTNRSYQVGASDPLTVSFKVRAYKMINGRRKYGEWSRVVYCYMNNY